MKTRPLFVMVPVVALVTGYFAWEAGYESNPQQPSTPSSTEPVALSPPANVEATSPPARDTDSVAGDETSRSSECEVGGTYIANNDGTATALINCNDHAAIEKHPYDLYSSAALESLAWSEAKAAEILGVRLRDKDLAKSMSLMIRASALSGGDTAPILQSFNMYPHAHEADGAPVARTIRTKFVLAAVADLLSGETDYVAEWESKVRRYSSNPEAETAALYKRARRIIEQMRQIQLEVTGSSTIGGQGDA